MFAAWEPPKLYANRGRWRDSREYAEVVKAPLAALKRAPTLERTLSRYAEARALVTGTTAIQGANGKFANSEESLVRNVDRRIFGAHRARSIVDLDRTTPADLAALRAKIDAGDVNAVYVHLAEGVDGPSRQEFRTLVNARLLTPATIIIHGTALEPADLDEVAAAGAKIVWSPQSNLRLYGRTTLAGAALARGIPVGLGADWLPSGSPSLLGELKVARQALIEEGRPATARQLVRMVTIDAAVIAGLGEQLGLLRPVGRPTSSCWIAVTRTPGRRSSRPPRRPSSWSCSVATWRTGGVDWVRALAGTSTGDPDPVTAERVLAWGRPMLVDTSYSVISPASPAAAPGRPSRRARSTASPRSARSSPDDSPADDQGLWPRLAGSGRLKVIRRGRAARPARVEVRGAQPWRRPSRASTGSRTGSTGTPPGWRSPSRSCPRWPPSCR